MSLGLLCFVLVCFFSFLCFSGCDFGFCDRNFRFVVVSVCDFVCCWGVVVVGDRRWSVWGFSSA